MDRQNDFEIWLQEKHPSLYENWYYVDGPWYDNAIDFVRDHDKDVLKEWLHEKEVDNCF
jgi:hypothetical protein